MSQKPTPQIGVRMPPDIREWLEASARKNLRSLNAEVVLALREKMQRSTSDQEVQQ